MNINEINSDIEKLKNGKESYDSCMKLASLITVRDFLTGTEQVISDNVEKEYSDILPTYREYCSIKKAYQLQGASVDKLLNSMDLLCSEIKEFIDTLYFNTQSVEERTKITDMLIKLHTDFVKKA